MNQQSRQEIMEQFKQELANGNVLLGVGAGTGITAKSSEAGGADMAYFLTVTRIKSLLRWGKKCYLSLKTFQY